MKIPAANIKVQMDYIGGGFGSKFAPGAWAEVGAILSQKAGGKPVKIFLDRAAEQQISGHRPSAYGKIKIAGKKDGSITAWQSDTWASGGFPGGGSPPLPYVFSNIPNQRRNHTSLSTNIAGPQAWTAGQPAGQLPDVLRDRGLRRQGRAWTRWRSSARTRTSRRARRSTATSSTKRRSSANGRSCGSRAARRPAQCGAAWECP
jgi:hypothetical protein